MELLSDVLVDSIKDTAQLIPFLLVTYLAMETLEHSAESRMQDMVARAGAAGPVVGALLGAYISRYTQNAGAFRSNLCAIFIIENTFRIFLYAFTGILTLPLFLTALRLMPFMLAGLLCGIACSNHIEEKQLQKIIMFLLILSGIMLIAVNL